MDKMNQLSTVLACKLMINKQRISSHFPLLTSCNSINKDFFKVAAKQHKYTSLSGNETEKKIMCH